MALWTRAAPDELLPPPNAGIELNAKEIGQAENGRTLAVRVAVEGFWRLLVGVRRKERIEDVGPLERAAGDEVREARDIGARDVVVGDAPIVAVADVALGEQIVLVERLVGTVSAEPSRRAPAVGQRKAVVAIHDLTDNAVEGVFTDVPLVDPDDLAAI